MPALRHRAGDRVCVDAAVPGARAGRAGGDKTDGAAPWEPDARGDRAGGGGAKAGAHALGTAQAEAGVGTRSAGATLAGSEHDRGVAEARGIGGGAQAAAANRALYRA